MKTPVWDFVNQYAKADPIRFHMPGHKGKEYPFDITEISGADVLYSATGIIAESRKNASRLFGTYDTFYSAEGSTLAIKAMLALVTAGKENKVVLASRNAHKAFIYGCALLDITPQWIYPSSFTDICACDITAQQVEECFANSLPCAVYITSPDYLGNRADIHAISRVCRKYGVPLLVDNAHGAYTAFLKESEHPIHLGADMCCDSAHKTLPVLTGGAYLHISESGKGFAENAESALSLFASTSPSYLILASLDRCNAYLADGYRDKLENTVKAVEKAKTVLLHAGYELIGSEKTKITLSPLKKGYTGKDIEKILIQHNVYPEFSSFAYTVLMITPENTEAEINAVTDLLTSLPDKESITKPDTDFSPKGERQMSVREAMLADKETVSVKDSVGRICACPTVSCPPAIPIVISGEIITESAVKLFEQYGTQYIEVVKKSR